MLRALNIRDFVIVDRIDLEFRDGFTALTGETGAGKSILVDAIAMVLGERGDAGSVRQGAAKAEIAAEFATTGISPLQDWLTEHDLAGDDETLLLRRVIDTNGRSRAFINGRSVPLAQLREASQYLVDIHGQHEHQSLLRASAQREMLDAYAQLGPSADIVRERWRQWQEFARQLAIGETDAAALAREREQLEWQVRELEALNMSADEYADLQAEHSRLAHAQALVEGTQFALDALSEDDQASLSRLAAVASRLDQMAEHDPRLKEVIELVAAAQAHAQDAAYALRDYQQRLELDPRRLDEVERRVDALHACARKYRIGIEALPETLTRSRARLQQMTADADLDALRQREQSAKAQYLEAARKLSSARRQAARAMSEKATAAMQKLSMAGGRFEVALTALEEGNATGLDHIEFLVAPHKGSASRPLAKVASGGELSRISLALQASASEIAQVPTLIFDEVDVGIGGGVAEIVGQMLKKLGRKHQVMCVTHLAQVAASADQQWRVAKTASDSAVSSHVAVLDNIERIEEIARMLGGVRITETTRKHAAEMLKQVKANV